MRLLSWNLLKSDGAGVEDIARLVERHAPDLVLMQEATAAIDALPRRLGGHYARREMQRRGNGPAAWSPDRFESEAVPLPLATRLDLPVAVFRPLRPRLALVLRIGALQVACVHLDHGQRANRAQLRHLLACRPGLDMVAGDFNAIGRTSLPGFVDVGPRRPTHLAHGMVPLRLDRCLVRDWHCGPARALAFGRSDHRPILLDLEPGPGPD